MEQETNDKPHRNKLALVTTVVIVALAALAVFLGRYATTEQIMTPQESIADALVSEPTQASVLAGPLFIDGTMDGTQVREAHDNVMVYTVGWLANHPSEFFEREVELMDMRVTRVINPKAFYVRPVRDIDAPEILVRTQSSSKASTSLHAGAVVGLIGTIRDARKSDPMHGTQTPTLPAQKAIADDLIYIDVDKVKMLS